MIDLATITLAKGSHTTRDDGVCVMEAVAWFAGEPHSDRPACASPVLTDYAIGLNDAWDDKQRQTLTGYIPRIAGTAGDGRDDERGLMAADWLFRTYTPAWLRLAGLHDQAQTLEDHAPLTDWSMLAAITEPLREARKSADAAWTAAGAAAADAAIARVAATAAAVDAATATATARAAAWAAARAAAMDATMDTAVEAALDAATAVALDAATARAAAADAALDTATAKAAARDAARAALQPTVDHLQASALDLLERMLSPVHNEGSE